MSFVIDEEKWLARRKKPKKERPKSVFVPMEKISPRRRSGANPGETKKFLGRDCVNLHGDIPWPMRGDVGAPVS